MTMAFQPDIATAHYFGAVLAYANAGPDTPEQVAADIESAAIDAFLEAFTAAAAELPQPMTFIDLAEARSHGYDAARNAAYAVCDAHNAAVQAAA